MVWELVLNNNPQVEAVVEIGTYQGGFSWYLWAQTQARQMRGFTTVDVIVPDLEPPGFVHLDVWREPQAIGDIVNAYDGAPIALFCDGGNKPRELKTFPPMCPPGSVFLVHDWGTETLAKDVPEFLEVLYGEFCDSIGSVTRVFKMKEDA